MSTYGIAGAQTKVHNNSWNKCGLALTMPNFVALGQEVCDISAVENFCSQESGTEFIKIA